MSAYTKNKTTNSKSVKSVDLNEKKSTKPSFQLSGDLDQEFEDSWTKQENIPSSGIFDSEFADSWNNDTVGKVSVAQVAQVVSNSIYNSDSEINNIDTELEVAELESSDTVLEYNTFSESENKEDKEDKENKEKEENYKKKREGELILDKLAKEGYEVHGINADMIIGEWKHLFFEEGLNYGHVSRVIRAVEEHGFETPRSIQMLSTVRIIRGGDLIAQAGAGNGKTGAFGIGAIISTDPHLRQIQKLIIVPTSTLVDQIFDVLTRLSRGTGITIQRWRGNLPYPKDKKPHIVIGTPGRVVDMIQPRRKNDGTEKSMIDLTYLRSLILDEGDELLAQGFRDQLKRIVETCPETSQVCLFSATLSPQVLNICNSFMRDPSVLIVPEKKVITTRVNQYYSKCDTDDNKVNDVIDCIEKNPMATIMIFCNTCSGIRKLSERLQAYKNPIRHICVNGKMLSTDREKAIKDFLSGSYRVLLASDIVGRGFDFSDVSIIMNYDMPNNIEAYIHRIGRAGRAGDIGNSVTLITTDEDMAKMRFIVQFHGMPIRETLNKTMKDGTVKRKFIFNL
jgi:superfamily II DNA/RNA helicase